MIVEGILNVVFGFIGYVVTLLPAISQLPNWFNSFCSMLKIGLFFFPYDVWCILIANISFNTFVLIAWSIIEWCYKKVPGID